MVPVLAADGEGGGVNCGMEEVHALVGSPADCSKVDDVVSVLLVVVVVVASVVVHPFSRALYEPSHSPHMRSLAAVGPLTAYVPA